MKLQNTKILLTAWLFATMLCNDVYSFMSGGPRVKLVAQCLRSISSSSSDIGRRRRIAPVILGAGIVGGPCLAFAWHKYRQNSLSHNWVYELPKEPAYVIDTDAGNDPDDLMALTYSIQDFGDNIKLLTTTLYRPEEKARLCKLFFQEFLVNRHSPLYKQMPHVSSGYGMYANEKDWMAKYPCWPEKFGIPGSTNQVSLYQGKAYRRYFSWDVDSREISQRTAVNDISSLCAIRGSDVVVIAQAPLTNVAHAFQHMQSINRIVMMGGWFENEQGGIARLGYNTAVDLTASRAILEQRKVPVLIVSSELVKKHGFVLTDRELQVMDLSPCKTSLGKALCDDISLYLDHRIPKGGQLALADMLTAYVAHHPEAISQTQPIVATFNPELLTIDMFHPKSKEVISVKEVSQSNIHIIKKLHDPSQVRMELVLNLMPLFYPHVSKDAIKALLLSGDEPKIIAEKLNKINAAWEPPTCSSPYA